MKIRYLGHSCFRIEESTGTSIVTDPYGKIGFEMPAVEADIVTVSHSHYDHNNVSAVGGKVAVIEQEGHYHFDGVEISALKSYHDEVKGQKRGNNLIFKFRMDGLDICHLGDLGEKCSSSLIESILPVHVLLIPVGGNYTIDAEEAKEYIDRLMPSIVIPMHYKTKDLNIDIEKVSSFIDLFDKTKIKYMKDSEIELFRDNITEESTKIIVMERFEKCN